MYDLRWFHTTSEAANLYVMNADGSGLERLTAQPMQGTRPMLRPVPDR